jgi:hypothetical protein
VIAPSRALPLLALAAALMASGCSREGVDEASTARASSGPPPVDRAGLRRERRIGRLLNRAIRAVERNERCRLPHPSERGPTFTDAAPSAELVDTFAVLRRPQTTEERIADDRLGRGLPAENIYRGAYRIATSAGGRRFLIVAAQNTNLFTPRPPECTDAFRDRFEQELEGRRPAFKRDARKVLRQVIRDEWTGGEDAGQPHEGLFMFDYADGGLGGGGGGVDLGFLRDRGMLNSQSRGSITILSGLLPDGVATVELTFPRSASRGPYRPAKRYRHAVELTAPVKDNVISLRVPRPAEDAFPARMVWKGPDGQTVKVVRARR